MGDILTVLIVEYSKAVSAADSRSNKKSDHGYAITGGERTQAYMPMYGLRGQGRSGFDNGASTSRQGSLTGKITAVITQITPSGNLVISGERQVKVNGETERIVVSGTVRPEDVNADNTVYSFNIANAKIEYSGKGLVDKGQKPSLIQKVLGWIF